MTHWTKKSAIHRLETNPRLQQILFLEPRLKPVLDLAACCTRTDHYDRIRTYIHLRNQAIPLVGWHADHPDLRNSTDYQLIVDTIADLLPPDNIDLSQDFATDP